MKKILVPCDFSATAVEAFKFAQTLAVKSGGEIHVLHMIDTAVLTGSSSLAYSYSFSAKTVKDLENKADSHFNAMKEAYGRAGILIKLIKKMGALVSGVKHYAAEQQMDLIVMGTQGHGQFGVGSNTGKVVRHVSIPVLTIRKEPARAVRKIVVPVSGQPDKDFFYELFKLQQFFGASLRLLSVNTPRTFRKDIDIKADLDKFARDGNLQDYSINIRSDFSAEHGIYAFAKEIDADLIAMGTHAWKGFVYLLAGSVAEDLVNHVDFPIWTFGLENVGQSVT
ncbi:MAG: universal stress protein [Cyclobacteriaceae bacterium]|nr:universal stress protein [Cyclobacteriaceae bacterium]